MQARWLGKLIEKPQAQFLALLYPQHWTWNRTIIAEKRAGQSFPAARECCAGARPHDAQGCARFRLRPNGQIQAGCGKRDAGSTCARYNMASRDHGAVRAPSMHFDPCQDHVRVLLSSPFVDPIFVVRGAEDLNNLTQEDSP
jgi:hypothetical protein